MRKWVCDGVEFKSGDKAMVMKVGKSLDPDGMGVGRKWHNAWVNEMESDIFKIFEIDFISPEGAHFVEPDDKRYYAFPLNVLMNLTAAGVIDNNGSLIAEKFKEVVNV